MSETLFTFTGKIKERQCKDFDEKSSEWKFWHEPYIEFSRPSGRFFSIQMFKKTRLSVDELNLLSDAANLSYPYCLDRHPFKDIEAVQRAAQQYNKASLQTAIERVEAFKAAKLERAKVDNAVDVLRVYGVS